MISGHASLDQISGENRSFQSVADPGFTQAGPENFADERSKMSVKALVFICQFICILPFFFYLFFKLFNLH